jgi:hypothetical protein
VGVWGFFELSRELEAPRHKRTIFHDQSLTPHSAFEKDANLPAAAAAIYASVQPMALEERDARR